MALAPYLGTHNSSLGIASNSRPTQLLEMDSRACRSLLASTSGNVVAVPAHSNNPINFRVAGNFQKGTRFRTSMGGGIFGVGCLTLLPARPEMRMRDLQERSSKVEHSSRAELSHEPALPRRSLVKSMILVAASIPFLGKDSSLLAAPLDSVVYREYVDRLDGYTFSYPSGWVQVKGAGSDVFFRDPVNLDESVVVDFSSPSSSRYKSVRDLGTPQQAAEKVLKQKITEFMSTRLGVRRESNIVSAKSRVGADGRLYYDIEVDVKSYANTNQLAVMPEDRVAKLEWSRRYLSTLGVENNRLYELKLQAPERVLANEEIGLRQIMSSFQLVKLEA